jgi:hypothetical protein
VWTHLSEDLDLRQYIYICLRHVQSAADRGVAVKGVAFTAPSLPRDLIEAIAKSSFSINYLLDMISLSMCDEDEEMKEDEVISTRLRRISPWI